MSTDKNVSIDIQSRRVRMVFYNPTDLDCFEAKPAITTEDWVINSAFSIAKFELLTLTKLKADEILTKHQKKVFYLFLEGLSKYRIAACLDKERCRNTGYSVVYSALFGDRRMKFDKKYRVGGLFTKLRKALIKNKRIKHLLNVIKAVKNDDYDYSLRFLQSKDKWWKNWNQEINND